MGKVKIEKSRAGEDREKGYTVYIGKEKMEGKNAEEV